MNPPGKKYLVVKGCAGLGNRLFTICSAIDYTIKTNRTLIIDWTDGQFGVKGQNVFHEYFSIKGIEILKNLRDIPHYQSLSFYPQIWKEHPEQWVYDSFLEAHHLLFDKIPQRLLFHERLKMLKGFWLSNEKKEVPTSALHFLKEAFNSKNIPLGQSLSYKHNEDVLFYIDFATSMKENIFREYIVLQPSIAKKIDSFLETNSLGKNAIGVHVRFSDKKPAKQIEELFSKISSLNLTNPKIFLATDNADIAELVKQKYINVIEYPKLKPDIGAHGLHQWALYNNQQQQAQQILEESIIDMWLLSKCEYLIYQGNSSFSKIAVILHPDKSKRFDWN